MSEPEVDGQVLATITITKVLTEDDVLIYVDATLPDSDGDLPLVEALGMMELSKDTLIRQAMGEDHNPDD